MPFDNRFDDIYKFGIKGAADDVGAYAERIDEQIFSEGILDRIFNQISKADVIVADMTGRNPNVFYEVGYAHALGKTVILLTQNADDIPFDLKHRQHTVYGGKIELLRKELASKLQWAIAEARGRTVTGGPVRISVRVLGVETPAVGSADEIPTIPGIAQEQSSYLPIHIRNDSLETIREITHIYLFTSEDSKLVPSKSNSFYGVSGGQWRIGSDVSLSPGFSPLQSFKANSVDASDGLSKQFRISANFSALPPGAVEEMLVPFMFLDDATEAESNFRLRFHTSAQYHEFHFRLKMALKPKGAEKKPDIKPLKSNKASKSVKRLTPRKSKSKSK